MKLIAAMIRPHILEEVRQSLQSIGVNGLTVTEVVGYGHQQRRTELYRGTASHIDFASKIKLEVAVDDALIEQAIDAVSVIAKTGRYGDGKLFISELEQVFRIRTGESGVFAL